MKDNNKKKSLISILESIFVGSSIMLMLAILSFGILLALMLL